MGRRRIAELTTGSRSDVDGQSGADNGDVHPVRETNQNTKAYVLGTRRSFEGPLEYGIDGLKENRNRPKSSTKFHPQSANSIA